MADPDYRALCARMADELDHYRQLLMDDRREAHALATEARALLAQPVAEGAPLSSVTNCHISGPAPKPFTNWTDYFNHVQQSGVISGLKIEAICSRRPTPQPPADGEVAELAAELRHFVAGYQQMRGLDPEHVYSIHRGDAMEAHLRISRLFRIAELLERQHPQPVEVSERPWERKGWCDEQGRCWIFMPDIGTDPSWRLTDPRDVGPYHTHSLPANALPTPEIP